MLTYEPGETPAHRLDSRSKLAFQVGFAVAVFTHPRPAALAGMTLLALGVLAAARLSPLLVLRTSRFILLLLLVGAGVSAFVPGSPWIDPARGVDSLLAGYRVVLVLFVAGAYVRTTPVRETRAAVQRHLPGRAGPLLGIGIALVYRFTPVLQGDLGRRRAAIRARGGERRSLVDRTRRMVQGGVRGVVARADTLSVALRARCFAWNPTLPPLRFRRADYPVVALGLLLAVSPLL